MFTTNLPQRSFYFLILFSVLVFSACQKATDEARFLEICKDNSSGDNDDCKTIAQLRAAFYQTGENKFYKSKEKDDAFRFIADASSQSHLPKLVCKKNIAGGIYCVRSTDVLAIYSEDAIREIMKDFKQVSEQLHEQLSESGIVYCPDGSVHIFEVGELDDQAFRISPGKNSKWVSLPVFQTQIFQKSQRATDQENALMDQLSQSGCGDTSGEQPPPGGNIPGNQQAFNSCLTSNKGSYFSGLSNAIQIAEYVKDCMEPALTGGSIARDDPLAKAYEDMENLMEAAKGKQAVDTSQAGASTVTVDGNGNTVISYTDDEGTWSIAIDSDGETYLVAPDGGSVEMGNVNEGVAFENGPFSFTLNDENGTHIKFKDESSISINYEEEKITSNSNTNSYCADFNEDPCLETLPNSTPKKKKRKRRRRKDCPPDDVACFCGGSLDLAINSLEACIGGTPECFNLTSSFECCEESFGQNPWAQPDPTGEFVCQDDAKNASETVLFCAERCSEFIWDDCMDWCLNGPTVQKPGPGWLDNMCLYVSGLECPQLVSKEGAIFPKSGSEGGWGLPETPEKINETINFNLIFAEFNDDFQNGLLVNDSEGIEK